MNILDKHPDLEPFIGFMKTYSSYDTDGQLIEKLVKDESTGDWKDITEQERLKMEILAAQRELEKLQEKIDAAKEK